MRHNQRLAIAAGLGLAVACAIPAGSAHAISGGTEVSSAPWAVQVYNNGRFACTGTMLTDRWVLTAYHCYNDEPGKMSVRVGDPRIGHGTKADVTAIRHLDDTDHLDDVALFRLAKPVKAPHVKLTRPDPPKGAVVGIYGYGNFGPHPKNLRKATNRVTSVKHDDILGRAVWTKKLTGDSEPGDSGGPAFYKGEQVGVLFGPNQYSSVASHRSWIRSVTGV
ncbi:S1 family peptidase [Streptomyces niveiscabiei]|uniref:S1 family peptidase n=1 Tax=Streptomyces niveiscabiei TaxID=164115 RepID=UPI0006EB58DD|nr:trypsin-like serine protease [Streptomyces niveiscabiei]